MPPTTDAAPPPFHDLPRTAAHHFRLHYFAAVSHVLRQALAAFPSPQAALDEFPFLAGYQEELARRGVAEREPAWWDASLRAWEREAGEHLPLVALREAGALDHRGLSLLFAVGLNEEDGRFGLLFEALQATPGVHRPTWGLLSAWWREPIDGGEARAALRRLRELALVQVSNPDAPRVDHALQPQPALWDAIRGDRVDRPAPWLRCRPAGELFEAGALVLPDATRAVVDRVPPLLAAGEVRSLIVRGPHRNGRRTLVGALARALGRGVVEVQGLGVEGEERLRVAGTLATLLHAVPVLVIDPAPGETVELPALPGLDGPLAVVMGRQGGVTGAPVERGLTVTLEMPDPAARRLHVLAAGGVAPDQVEVIADRFRLTSGNIQRAVRLARSCASLAGREAARLDDLQEASRALNREALDTLAVRMEAVGDWSRIALPPDTQRDLWDLERRCRYRERLERSVGPALRGSLRAGVRALFSGPSGTGKTLAARLLGGALRADVYRVDLASVVNKYIGETEKNLGRIFSLAEELDVVLLLDEGDALLAQRTAVQTSNDRYANLETNYLLQRIESFDGILLLTTNAAEHIDSAFQRRMDVVVDFRAPEAAERHQIWQLHLPADHAVDPALLREVATRCTLTGGQIRNAVLHAAMVALDAAVPLRTEHLEAALVREYRKIGAVYPLRRVAASLGARPG